MTWQFHCIIDNQWQYLTKALGYNVVKKGGLMWKGYSYINKLKDNASKMAVKNTGHLLKLKKGGLWMNNRKIGLTQDLNDFDFGETKKNINNFFDNLY